MFVIHFLKPRLFLVVRDQCGGVQHMGYVRVHSRTQLRSSWSSSRSRIRSPTASCPSFLCLRPSSLTRRSCSSRLGAATFIWMTVSVSSACQSSCTPGRRFSRRASASGMGVVRSGLRVVIVGHHYFIAFQMASPVLSSRASLYWKDGDPMCKAGGGLPSALKHFLFFPEPIGDDGFADIVFGDGDDV